MKILFDHPNPFLLAHGGFQTQIEQTREALVSIGVEVEYLRWWDDSQRGDIIHYFGRPSAVYIHLAQQKGMKLVLAELLTELGSRSGPHRLLQKAMIGGCQRVLPAGFTARMAWDAYGMADACVALTPWEARLMVTMFGAAEGKVFCVPNGVESAFLDGPEVDRGKWLVCTATITERKRVLDLAEAALVAKTPVWILGRPYSEKDEYGIRFEKLAKENPSVIRYEGAVSERAPLAQIYREARGFVLLSAMESLSLSALEAAACGCPLLLSDLPWARTVFQSQASYCSIKGSAGQTGACLRRFYDEAPQRPRASRPKSWVEVAELLRGVYGKVMDF